MESKVGRMNTGFYTLIGPDNLRMAYLWQRQLFTDMPNTPHRLHLELYEGWNDDLWVAMFGDLRFFADKVERLREYLADGDITLQRIRRSPSGLMGVVIYDGEQLVISTPRENAVATGIVGVTFPKSLMWSNLVIKEARREQRHLAAG